MTTIQPRRRAGTAAAILLLFLAGCGGDDGRSDAYGTFEATEVLVSVEASGRLVRLSVNEGDRLEAGVRVGQVDTVQLALKADQIRAQRSAVRARLPGIAAQVDVLEQQRRVAERDLARIQALVADGAATEKQLDDIQGQIQVIERQVESIRSQNAPVFAELDVLDAQLESVKDQIRRAGIVNPVRGTVLATYAEASELTSPGKPLYRIAPLDTLDLRAYVSGAQLPHVRIGQAVTVLIDEDGSTNRSLSGRITWIASQSEFTPKLIQTKEERVNLVYAVKVRVANPEGRLKIGMPGEVLLEAPAG